MPESLPQKPPKSLKDCEVGDVNLKQIGVAGVTMAQLRVTMKATYGLIG